MLNFLFRLVVLLRKTYWFIFRPVTLGVKVIAMSGDKILLIKTRYDKYWYLPGGGVKSGEMVINCAKREIAEEVGVKIEEFDVLGIFSNFSEYKSDHVVLFHADITGQSFVKGLEIDELKLFDFEKLPEDISPATMRRIKEYQSGAIKNGKW